MRLLCEVDALWALGRPGCLPTSSSICREDQNHWQPANWRQLRQMIRKTRFCGSFKSCFANPVDPLLVFDCFCFCVYIFFHISFLCFESFILYIFVNRLPACRSLALWLWARWGVLARPGTFSAAWMFIDVPAFLLHHCQYVSISYVIHILLSLYM